MKGSIAINLLPPEILLERRHSSKLYLLNNISIGVLVVLIFLTSATLAIKFSQNSELKKAEQDLAYAEGKVSALKGREDQTLALKQRLSSIESLTGGDAKMKKIFNLVVYLIPPDMQVSTVTVDKNGNMSIALSGFSVASLETLISNLSDKDKNADLIARVDLEGISIGRDSTYRFSMKIAPK